MADRQARRDAYSRLSSAIAYLDDVELRALVAPPPRSARAGWGASCPAQVDGRPVFVKRVPLTDVERAHMFSTRNRFRLPTYYNYGVGSAGFGVFRELAAHVKTTNWVLEGAIDSFPLLYHARVMERRAPAADPRFDPDDYVRYWNGSKAVANYMAARAAARYEVWLILEHFPHTLATWLPANQGAVHQVVGELCHTIDFLHSHGVLHLDANPSNVVGDGQTLCLTDFGLVLDAEFQLTDRERAFLQSHSHYDYGEAITSLGAVLLGMFRSLEPAGRERIAARYDLPLGTGPHRLLGPLIDHLPKLHADGDLPVEAPLVEAVVQYREVILYMVTFFSDLRRNPRKTSTYDDATLRRLLDAAGVALG